MRVSLILLLIAALCLPGKFVATAHAETVPIFRLDAGKPAGGKVIMTLSVENVNNVYGYEARLSFDPDKLELLGAKSNLDGFSVSPIIKKNEIIIAHTKIGSVPGDSGNITIGTLTFKLKKHGQATVKWESMKVVTDKLLSTTITVGKSVSTSKSFIDLTGHWAKADIELLASEGIIEGMDDDHFVPDMMVTRAQFAAMLVRALNLKASEVQSPFTDVPSASWYAGVVSSAYSSGIIKGVTDSRFAPEQDITREEMTVMLIRAGRYMSEGTFNDKGSVDSIPFVDASSISEWAIRDVEIAVREGIINGRTANTFGPQSLATRAEAAVVMKRLLSKP
ncbi:S-layer homology domain-containing protein [Paenibacillus eucommiae]|uniref:SLH domain-containing protein n=1 Tax=Paenibacillus eucommiae TaxID=1355755 RepID=A0ABS4JB60_9BACL|nr:S-layer homology domain-containing protein [Paenibacillus eucommiae]MBP1997089.1 hypothetical protein [Paenibacillus eucommiae]